MRLKHVKGAEEIVENSKYVIKDYTEHKGSFNKLFNNNNPIRIEIGMGKGNFIIENAIKYPNINFIGIEKYDSVMVKAIRRLDTLDLPNLRLIRMDAGKIEEVFDHEIDEVYLNFSDPWPKDRHAKRRLTSPKFLNKYKTIFKDKEIITFKTDNRKLFEYSVISFNTQGFTIENLSLDLYNDDIKDNIPTEYEMKFHSKGFPIYKIRVYK
ncbi:MAG: tRNA (guanosine(46)-N7)-methyltransferase TrmB [Bacilli bacterium]|nr:tRNA (guanosine(46)-N7)-methyltransferase TrmB [Bacilli bacterium]